MTDLNGFNAHDVEPIDFEPLPEGDYLAAITRSETKATKRGDGSYLALTIQISPRFTETRSARES